MGLRGAAGARRGARRAEAAERILELALVGSVLLQRLDDQRPLLLGLRDLGLDLLLGG